MRARRAARAVAVVVMAVVVVSVAVARRGAGVVAWRSARVAAWRALRSTWRRRGVHTPRRGRRVSHGAVPHPVLGGLLPVRRLRVGRQRRGLHARRGREELWLPRRGGERGHVRRLRGWSVRRRDVAEGWRVRGRVERWRVRSGRVV